MKTVYLSGPISLGGRADPREIGARLFAFDEEARRLTDAGYRVVNPADLPTGLTWEGYMRHAMHAIADADIVAVLPRWEESRGARLEVFVARELRIPVVEAETLP